MHAIRESVWADLPADLCGPMERRELIKTGQVVKIRLGLAGTPIQLREAPGRHWQVRAVGFAGTIGVGGTLIDVCPRFLDPSSDLDWRGTLSRMVAIRHGIPLGFIGEGRAGPSKASFFDHLAIAFAQGCHRAVQIGPILSYAPVEEVETVLRGRLNLAGQTRILLAGRFGVAQTTSAMTEDNIHVALLRWALEFLSNRARGPSVRSRLDALNGQIPLVSTPLSAAVIEYASKPPMGASQWEEPLALARALYMAHGAGQQGNDVSLPGLVFHTAEMFEALVRYVVAISCRAARVTGLPWSQPRPKSQTWIRGMETPIVRRVRPDSLVHSGETIQLIIDAKNKNLVGGGVDMRPNPAREDLHEVLSYMVHFGCPHSLLLYPHASPDAPVINGTIKLETTGAGLTRIVYAARLNVHRAVYLSPRTWAEETLRELQACAAVGENELGT